MRFGLREFVFVALLLAMPAAAYFLVFAPRNDQMAQAREEIRLKQLKLKQLDAAMSEITDLGQEIVRLTDAIAMFEQKLPAQREVDVILGQVWDMAAKQRLLPKSVRTDKPVNSSQYTELPIKMVIVGGFDGFYNFLLELEKLPRITQLSKLKIERLDSEEGEMQAEMVLSIFFEGADSSKSGSRS